MNVGFLYFDRVSRFWKPFIPSYFFVTHSKRVLSLYQQFYLPVPGFSLRFFANMTAISVIIAFYRSYEKVWNNFTQGISFWCDLRSFNNFKRLLESVKEKVTEFHCFAWSITGANCRSQEQIVDHRSKLSITGANYYRNYSQCLVCLVGYTMNGHNDPEDCA